MPLAKAAAKSTLLIIITILSACMALWGVQEVVVLLAAGVLFVACKKTSPKIYGFLPLLIAGKTVTNTQLFLIFLKIGAILYGSGYVLFSYIDTALVERGLLSRQELMDAIAVGQFTPGPVFSSVTFVGYQVNGFWGAMAATAGVFLPSFILVAFLGLVTARLEKSAAFNHFITAVNAASVGVIAATCINMGAGSVVTLQAVAILIFSTLLLLFFPRINTASIILFGGVSGYLMGLF